MTMIEIDPKLFVTCRLCLEGTGLYQIVPKIQKQIEYCFDIHVEPFDGLPQLICKKCQGILSDYFQIKKTFVEKQQRLKKNPMSCIEEPQQAVSSSQLVDVEGEIKSQPEENILNHDKKRIRVISSSSSSEVHSEVKKISWKDNYTKQFVCRFCSKRYKTKRSIIEHIQSHDNYLFKYSSAQITYCTIRLKKTDRNPVTGSDKHVVIDKNTIIGEGNSYYYIAYSLRDKQPENAAKFYSRSKRSSLDVLPSEDEEIQVRSKKRKFARLISRSSNETVALDEENKSRNSPGQDLKLNFSKMESNEPQKVECINIDDSSSDSTNSKMSFDPKICPVKKILPKEDDIKSIQNIISICHSKCLKKLDNPGDNSSIKNKDSNSDSYLKHKILSIGTKIISKGGFANNGILRYLEQKHLDIVWVPVARESNNYVRIMMKPKEECLDDETGWKKICVNTQQTASSVEELTDLDETNKDLNIDVMTASFQESECAKMQCTVLPSPKEDISDLHLKKLLNESPVANPKQLPKKTDSKLLLPPLVNTTEQSVSNDASCVYPEISEIPMPIITSTTSLAPKPVDNKQNDDIKTNNAPVNSDVTSQPRIKVKPASELMSDSVLNNYNAQTHAGLLKNVSFVNFIPAVQAFTNTPVVPIPEPTKGVNREVPGSSSELLVLDTIELPNTRTASPFKYLQNLLQVHGITLLNSNEIVAPEFISLIKFRVVYNQDTAEVPFFLSLLCSKNIFYLKVTDRTQTNIDINKLTAKWQWELLKTFKGDIVRPLLQIAQKKGQDIYEFTKTFLCLLDSINLK